MTTRQGMSLMEVLITLVIVGLIMGLVFDGIGGAARLSLRLTDAADALDRQYLAAEWWRRSVASALPTEGPDPPTFIGGPDRLQIATVSPLHARIGATRLVEWRLEREPSGAALVYAFGEETWTVARTANPDPRFAYRAAGEDVWRERWTEREPPALVALEGLFTAPVLAHPRTRMLPVQPSENPAEVRS